MLWYNNPDVIKAIHDDHVEARHELNRRRTLLRIARGDDATIRH